MYSKIIVGYDGSDHSRDGLALGRLLAQEAGAALVVAHVLTHGEDLRPDDATLEGVEAETRALRSSSAARGLHDLAESERADLIVLGSTHRGGVGRVLMGSVAERLLHGGPCAVAIAPGGFAEEGDPMLRVIGVAFDATPESRAALNVAAELGEASAAALRIFGVAESGVFLGYTAMAGHDPADLVRSQKEYLHEEIAKAIESLPHKLRPLGEVLSGNAAELLAAKADEGVDLLVTGSRGYGPARRVLLGSVSSKLARSAPCPLLVVPRTGESSERLAEVGGRATSRTLRPSRDA